MSIMPYQDSETKLTVNIWVASVNGEGYRLALEGNDFVIKQGKNKTILKYNEKLQHWTGLVKLPTGTYKVIQIHMPSFETIIKEYLRGIA